MSESNLALRLAIAASVAVHLAVVLAGLGYAGFLLVPLGPEQTIAVDLVTPQEVADLVKPPEPQAAPPAPASEKGNEPTAEAPPPLPEPAEAQKNTEQKSTTPQPETMTLPKPATGPQPPVQTGVRAPEPDISVRYPMNLSLFGSMPGDFDAKASTGAQIDDGVIAAFRAQLKTCSTLPAEIATGDKVVIVIRAQFSPDGRLAATPILIEASASAKGPLLMQAAIAALQACQPYASLPVDKYQEWKLLDLNFTPQDFRRG